MIFNETVLLFIREGKGWKILDRDLMKERNLREVGGMFKVNEEKKVWSKSEEVEWGTRVT